MRKSSVGKRRDTNLASIPRPLSDPHGTFRVGPFFFCFFVLSCCAARLISLELGECADEHEPLELRALHPVPQRGAEAPLARERLAQLLHDRRELRVETVRVAERLEGENWREKWGRRGGKKWREKWRENGRTGGRTGGRNGRTGGRRAEVVSKSRSEMCMGKRMGGVASWQNGQNEKKNQKNI